MASSATNGASEAQNIEQRLLGLIKSIPSGISDKELSEKFPELTAQQRAVEINKLVRQGLCGLFKKGDTVIYRAKDTTNKPGIKCVQNEEKIVYEIIEAGGNKGVWNKEIRDKSNLHKTQLNKIIKNLESKKIIKPVKSVNANKQKMYMLYDLTPDRSITGGAWYHGHDFDFEFVEVLNQQCLKYLIRKCEIAKTCDAGPLAARDMTYAKVEEVHQFIKDLKICKIELDLEDLETILKTLVYDGKAESTPVDGNFQYRAVHSLLKVPGLVYTPCGICPVSDKCADTGAITPKKCTYLSEWLDY